MNSRVAAAAVLAALVAVATAEPAGYESVVLEGEWNYEDTTWAEYPTCVEGKRQSPIDVTSCRAQSSCNRPVIKQHVSKVGFHAETEHYALHCENTETPCSTMTYDGVTYEMLQMHAHAPSENTLNGQSFPMEMHYVHAAPEGGFAVLGVFYKIGKHNPEIQQFIESAAMNKSVTIDISKMYHEHAMMCHFKGSLTTPPCTEGINWFVSWGVQEMSNDQLYNYRALSGQGPPGVEPHNRPVQPLNGRDVACVH